MTDPRSDAEPRVLGRSALSERLEEITVWSPALQRESRLRLLHPVAGADNAVVLYLLHGGGADSDHTNWTDKGRAEALTDGLPVTVVMPDGGRGGWYCDWLHPDTPQGRQHWETHHVNEIPAVLGRELDIPGGRNHTAIAGLSMGGHGALSYAARHPERYGFAAAFSGAVDVAHRGIAKVIDVSPLIMGGDRGAIFGPLDDDTRRRAHNPVDLADSLSNTVIELRTGNGQPGGRYGHPDGIDTQEVGCSQATATLHARLDQLGIDHVYDDYGPAAHDWPYWNDSLAATLTTLMLWRNSMLGRQNP